MLATAATKAALGVVAILNKPNPLRLLWDAGAGSPYVLSCSSCPRFSRSGEPLEKHVLLRAGLKAYTGLKGKSTTSSYPKGPSSPYSRTLGLYGYQKP